MYGDEIRIPLNCLQDNQYVPSQKERRAQRLATTRNVQ